MTQKPSDPVVPSAIATSSAHALEQILPMVYTDALQPGVKQVGIALETVLGLVPTLMLPLQYLNEGAKLLFARHMESLRLKIQAKPAASIVAVPPEIGVPVIERLMHTQDPLLADLYLDLLASAADEKATARAHPSFVQLIANLSPDEAALLQLFHDPEARARWPYLEASLVEFAGKSEPVHLRGPLTGWELLVRLRFPDKLPAYLNNLSRCGVFALSPAIGTDLTPIESSWDHRCRDLRIKYQDAFGRSATQGWDVCFAFGALSLTEYGRMFVDACVSPHPELLTGETL